jgi:MFS family permease
VSASPTAAASNRELARLTLCQVCLHSSMAGMRMAAPLWVLQHGHGAALAGLVVALFALVQIFLLLPAGRYADRHGLQRPLRWCVGASTLALASAAAWPQLWVLCLAAALCGSGAGAANLVLQRHVGRAAATPEQMRRAFAWLAIAPAAAHFVGPLVAGLAIDYGGWRIAFALLAVLPLLSWLFVRRTPELPNDAPPAGERAATWDLLRMPALRRLLLMNWFMSASWDLHAFLVPVLGHQRGISASVIGSVLAAFAAGTIAVRLLVPLLGPRLREWMLISGANALTGLLLVSYPFTNSLLSMGLCSAALGMATGSMQPMVNSLMHQLTPRHRHGEAIAVRLTMINVSMCGMPLLLGLAGGAIGVSAVFWSMGLAVGASSSLGWRLRDVGGSG